MGYTGQKKKVYQRAYLAERRAAWIDANGPCAQCGSEENLRVVHKDKKGKKMKTASIWSLRMARRKAALRYCQVMCDPCFKRKQAEEQMQTKHGKSRYRSGLVYRSNCGCEECKKGHASYQKLFRAHKPFISLRKSINEMYSLTGSESFKDMSKQLTKAIDEQLLRPL